MLAGELLGPQTSLQFLLIFTCQVHSGAPWDVANGVNIHVGYGQDDGHVMLPRR